MMKPKKISFEKRINPVDQPESDEVRIAVTGVMSPSEAFIYYGEVFDYISEKLGKPVKLVQRETYHEI